MVNGISNLLDRGIERSQRYTFRPGPAMGARHPGAAASRLTAPEKPANITQIPTRASMQKKVLSFIALITLGCDGDSTGPRREHLISVPGDFATIQAAVNDAQPNDTIEIAPGTYAERVVINKSDLTIIGLEGTGGARVILDGTNVAGGTGLGIHVLGTLAAPVTNVEIKGLVVRNFERGVVLENVEGSRLLSNEMHNNTDKNAADGVFNLADGVVLISARFNTVSENFSHDNGHDGFMLRDGSAGNLITNNQAIGNGGQTMPGNNGCGIDVSPNGNNNGNQVVENEVLRNAWGIRIGSTTTSANFGNIVLRNTIRENARAGVTVRQASIGNVITDNVATGNGTANLAPTLDFDLFDEGPKDNTWERNQGRANFTP
jgi:parallel beta-helix repeat protein